MKKNQNFSNFTVGRLKENNYDLSLRPICENLEWAAQKIRLVRENIYKIKRLIQNSKDRIIFLENEVL